ncbi:MAG: glycosyltransferase [Bacteroidetes bacterium]|nr:glycosyltransferase [Bacteroidota bacterium]
MSNTRSCLVSFVVPCYNYGRYLAECLNSIFSQDYICDFEVIVIDDGSIDNTQEVLRSFSDPRLRVIVHPVNRGHVITINEGLSLAQGDFIARIDPDDRYRPYFLRTVLEKFNQYPEVGLVYGDVSLIDMHGCISLEQSDNVHGGKDFKGNEFVKLLERNFICSPSVIARREAWIQALPVPDGLAFHDWYFTLMIARKYEFYYVNKVIAEYRVHPHNYHTIIAKNKKEEESIFRLLDRIFAEVEEDPKLEEQKQKARRRIYGTQYLDLGRKYFGFGMYADARRCLLQAIRYRPRYFLCADVMRWLIATYIGRERYEMIKSSLRRLFPLRG